MCQFSPLAHFILCIQMNVVGITQTGFPHSEISGLKVVCTYPKLIAACHVLHRLHVPRHPPYALSSFTKGSWSREWSLFIKINKDSQLFSVTKWSYRLPHSLQKTIHICESTSIPNFQKTKTCGADRDRTCDLLNANQVLSQLSYSPIKWQ